MKAAQAWEQAGKTAKIAALAQTGTGNEKTHFVLLRRYRPARAKPYQGKRCKHANKSRFS